MCAILRLVYYPKTWDATWEVWRAYVFGTLETNLAIICVCVPQLRKLASHIGSKIASSYNSSGLSNDAAGSGNDGRPRPGPGAEMAQIGSVHGLSQASTSSKAEDGEEDDTTPFGRRELAGRRNGAAEP